MKLAHVDPLSLERRGNNGQEIRTREILLTSSTCFWGRHTEYNRLPCISEGDYEKLAESPRWDLAQRHAGGVSLGFHYGLELIFTSCRGRLDRDIKIGAARVGCHQSPPNLVGLAIAKYL